ncbi:MAG TPA: RNA methyltransferase [Desulfobacterales bacterium]|nr:RNA methyltransferase [Desulfobacterales bacterium]
MAIHTSVVLVGPQGSLNIGSVARSMLNFGLEELRLVNPAVSHLNDEARRMAVKAVHILEQAQIYPDLQSALADCNLAMGATRRFGKYRRDFLHPWQAAGQIIDLADHSRAALVFGREDHGLSTDEIDLCQRLITIPVHDKLPSLNLAQAATVCLYELHKARSADTRNRTHEKTMAPGAALEAMCRHMRQTLLDIDFLDHQNPDHITRAFRQIFGRAGLNDREVQIMQGLWSRIDWLRQNTVRHN